MIERKFNMAKTITFHNQELQRQHDDLIAMANSPEFKAERKAELAIERRKFWRSYGLVAVAFAIGLGALTYWLEGLMGNVSMYSRLFAVVMPVTFGAFLYPR